MAIQALKRELWYQIEGMRHLIGLANRPTAAPHTRKRQIIRQHARKYRTRVLVETGTYLGDMVAAQLRHFREIYSIELSADLYAAAQRRFASQARVRLHQGDSASVLPQVLREIKEPALFWLDAHFSGGITSGSNDYVPIFGELDMIFGHGHPGHVVLIDDARLFVGQHGYPTLEQLASFVEARRVGQVMHVREDVIRILPPDLA